MIITFDTEFMEDGKTIELLSIGLVRADGQEFYAVSADADQSRANPWVAEHVLPHLRGPLMYRERIAQEIVEFAGRAPSFWAWYADYDWVALCQLYGTMLDLPAHFPMFARDLRQEADPTQMLPHDTELDGPEHHALADARWLMRNMRARGRVR